MYSLVRHLIVALIGGAVAAGILLAIDKREPTPNIALAQTSATLTSPVGADATDATARKMISYQGQVFNPNGGEPYINRGLNFSFRLYNNAAGTSEVFQEDRFVMTNVDGFFSTTIGESGQFGDVYNIFNGQELYLRVFINNQELGPIQPITFVPYAFWSVHAQHLEDYDAEDFPKIIAYGVVNGDGSRASGERFSSFLGTVEGDTLYIIDIEDTSHSIFEYTTIVTPACDAPVMTGVGTSNGDLLVDVWDPNGIRTTCRFEFMVLEK